MAVAGLSKVVLASSRDKIAVLLAKLMQFRQFHPSEREGLVQDFEILLMGSHAQEIYSKTTELLATDALRSQREKDTVVEKFHARDVEELIGLLEEYVAVATRHLGEFSSEEDKASMRNLMRAIQEASSVLFENLRRILVSQAPDGSIFLEGYVPSKSVGSFEQHVGEFLNSIEAVRKRGAGDPYVPSLLVNPRVVSLFERLTLQQGVPKYSEIDPTPIIAFVFPLFYGIMFGDIGHGIVLVLFGIFLRRRPEYTYWATLIIVFGLSAGAVGFVRGSFFGIEFASPLGGIVPLPEAFSAAFTFAYVPLLLEIAIVIGTVHMGGAYAIGFLNAIRSTDYVGAFLNRLSTLTLYTSIVLLGLAVAGVGLRLDSVFTSDAPTPFFYELLGLRVPIRLTAGASTPVAVASLLVLATGHPLEAYRSTHRLRKTARALGMGILEAATRPLEFFVNTVSYIRLGVLLIAATLLGSLVARVAYQGIPGIILAAAINVAVIALEGFIVYIQDMRLHLYEWFPKFYAGGGIPFDPLVSKGKLFEVEWTQEAGNELR